MLALVRGVHAGIAFRLARIASGFGAGLVRVVLLECHRCQRAPRHGYPSGLSEGLALAPGNIGSDGGSGGSAALGGRGDAGGAPPGPRGGGGRSGLLARLVLATPRKKELRQLLPVEDSDAVPLAAHVEHGALSATPCLPLRFQC